METKTYMKADEQQIGGTHYKKMPIEPWELMSQTLSYEEFVGYLKGNMIKYAMRAGHKAGSDDAKKYEHYKQKLNEFLGYI